MRMYRNYPKRVVENNIWNASAVRELCIREKWYTRGDNEEYSAMLKFVREHSTEPTPDNIWMVADDIMQHSEDNGMDVANYMYLLKKDTVMSSYEVWQ